MGIQGSYCIVEGNHHTTCHPFKFRKNAGEKMCLMAVCENPLKCKFSCCRPTYTRYSFWELPFLFIENCFTVPYIICSDR